MNLRERQRGLLRLVEDYREQECRRILTAARQKATELRRKSFHDQRTHLHRRIVAERSRARAAIQAAQAEQATRKRRTSERMSLELLESAWPLLRERLLAHWWLPEGRRRWAENHLRRALDLLPHGHWMVRHAPEWGDDERREVLAELTERLPRTPRFRSEGGMEAGLVIQSGGAVLDASLRGLLQDRAALEARLLALLAGGKRS